MTEAPSPIFYASAKPEAAAPKTESKLVRGVKNVVNKWIERVGPKGVENRFVRAHERILATLNDEQRKEAYAQTADRWRKWGKALGIAATVIDSSLVAFGLGAACVGIKNPEVYADRYLEIKQDEFRAISQRMPDIGMSDFVHTDEWFLHQDLKNLTGNLDADSIFDFANSLQIKPDRVAPLGRGIAAIPGFSSIAILFGSGPGHWLAHLAGIGAEKVGKMKAKTHNYVDSGKAAEHAAKIGNAVGKGVTEVAKYAAEHPDEIRKTVETVSRVKKEQAESAQKIAEAQKRAADAALDKEYKDWIAHHPDKTYYEQSGEPYPSKADYVAMKKQQEDAKKANLAAEKRGEAKKRLF